MDPPGWGQQAGCGAAGAALTTELCGPGGAAAARARPAWQAARGPRCAPAARRERAAPAAATRGSSAPLGSRRRRPAGPPKAAAPTAAAAAAPGGAARAPGTRVGSPPSRHASPLSRFSAGGRGRRLKGAVGTPPLPRALKGRRAPGGVSRQGPPPNGLKDTKCLLPSAAARSK